MSNCRAVKGNRNKFAFLIVRTKVPIATVHPYDGEAALSGLARVAARGVKVLKIHAHTQKFDVADPRVLARVKKAVELGVAVLMDNANILPGDSENLFRPSRSSISP